jgi:hypothetical protein
MIQNSISCIVPEKNIRRNLTLRTNSSDVMENDVLQRLSLVDSPSSSSSFGSSFSADESWTLSSYELPSPWNVEESRFDLSSPTATIHHPQVSQIRSIFRHQDQRQEHDDTCNKEEEEDEAYLEFFSPETKGSGSYKDPARMTPSSSFEHPSPLVRRIPTSPKRKSFQRHHKITLREVAAHGYDSQLPLRKARTMKNLKMFTATVKCRLSQSKKKK